MRFNLNYKTFIIIGGVLLLLLSVYGISSVIMDPWDGITINTPFNNKRELKPKNYVESELSGFSFESLVVEFPYVRESIETQEDIDKMYKKKVNWSTGSITEEEYKELQYLIGYDLNRVSDAYLVVKTPTVDDLKGIGEQVVYWSEMDKGILHINQKVYEYNEKEETIKEYTYQFKLKYNPANGMIEFL